jgi:hypothetical protein
MSLPGKPGNLITNSLLARGEKAKSELCHLYCQAFRDSVGQVRRQQELRKSEHP